MTEFLSAAVGAVALIGTGGFAFGGALRLKRIKELIEIRESLVRTNPSDRDNVDGFITLQVDALVMRRPTPLPVLWASLVASLAVSVGAFALFSYASFTMTDEARNLTGSVAAGACVLLGGAGFFYIEAVLSRSPFSWISVTRRIWGFLAVFVMVVLAAIIFFDTPYMVTLLGVGQ